MDDLAPPTPAEDFLEPGLALMTGQTPQNVLLRALWVLRDPGRWSPYHRATDREGKPVLALDPRASRWCLEGAVAMASNPWGVLPQYFMLLFDEVSLELYREDSVNCLEEYCTHDQVIRVLTRAIERTGDYGDY